MDEQFYHYGYGMLLKLIRLTAIASGDSIVKERQIIDVYTRLNALYKQVLCLMS